MLRSHLQMFVISQARKSRIKSGIVWEKKGKMRVISQKILRDFCKSHAVSTKTDRN